MKTRSYALLLGVPLLLLAAWQPVAHAQDEGAAQSERAAPASASPADTSAPADDAAAPTGDTGVLPADEAADETPQEQAGYPPIDPPATAADDPSRDAEGAVGDADQQASPGMSDAADYYYYYKQRVPLRLDTSRAAVYAPSGLGAESVDALTRHGIALGDVEAHAISGWHFARVPAGKADARGVAETVDSLSREPAFDFVTPVFFDDFDGPMLITQNIFVSFNNDVSEDAAQDTLAEFGVADSTDANWAGIPGLYRIRSHARNGWVVLETANRLAEHPTTLFAEPDRIFTGRSEVVPNDPRFGDSWGLHNTGQFFGFFNDPSLPLFMTGTVDMDMDAPEAWDITMGDPDIIAVVFDTGVQQDHPDLNVFPGEDFTDDNPPGVPDGDPGNACDNHGTTVAGCISGIVNNIGTCGIAPTCRVASARVGVHNDPCTNPDGTDSGWQGSIDWTINAIGWAWEIGARVTNNSNSYGNQPAALELAYAVTRSGGMVHFAAAGNAGVDQVAYPARIPCLNAVAALQPDGTRAQFSQWGDFLDFSAPGRGIWTTDRVGANGYELPPGDYAFMSGTSFAAPLTAGVAALVLSVDDSLNAEEVEEIMHQSCIDLGEPGYHTDYGWGFVNARNSVEAAMPNRTWLDFAWGGSEAGTFFGPYDTLAEAINAVPTGGTIAIKPGATSTTLTISKPMTIVSWKGAATIGQN